MQWRTEFVLGERDSLLLSRIQRRKLFIESCPWRHHLEPMRRLLYPLSDLLWSTGVRQLPMHPRRDHYTPVESRQHMNFFN